MWWRKQKNILNTNVIRRWKEMRDKKEISIEEIHKEIDLIQSCITRMAQNSFMIKGWFVSIYAVILALLP